MPSDAPLAFLPPVGGYLGGDTLVENVNQGLFIFKVVLLIFRGVVHLLHSSLKMFVFCWICA